MIGKEPTKGRLSIIPGPSSEPALYQLVNVRRYIIASQLLPSRSQEIALRHVLWVPISTATKNTCALNITMTIDHELEGESILATRSFGYIACLQSSAGDITQAVCDSLCHLLAMTLSFDDSEARSLHVIPIYHLSILFAFNYVKYTM